MVNKRKAFPLCKVMELGRVMGEDRAIATLARNRAIQTLISKATLNIIPRLSRIHRDMAVITEPSPGEKSQALF